MSNPWFKFYAQDYLGDSKLLMCSLAAQGLWIRLLCKMHENNPRGYLSHANRPLTIAQTAAIAGSDESTVAALLAELETSDVFSRNRSQIIYSRRMVEDEKRSKMGRKHVSKRYAQHTETKEEIPQPTRSATTPDTRSQNKIDKGNPLIFEGTVIRLNKKDFDAWLERYGGTEEQFFDWLSNRDDWFADKATPQARKNWFHSTSAAVGKLE